VVQKPKQVEMSKRRVIVIGIDGAPYGMIKRLAEGGTMPNVGALIAEGVFKPMASTLPEVSSVAWSSIITGTNPGVHGVFGFTDLAPGGYRTIFPNFSTLRAPPFWERKGAGRSVIINVPMTFPAREIHGALISGFVALDLERATFPPSLVPQLKEMDYRVDVDASRAAESTHYFLTDLDRTLKARVAAYRYLWREIENWQNFVLIFTGADRLSHYLWHAYEDASHPHHGDFVGHFQEIDQVIGEIVDRMREDDIILLLSDHGFELLEHEIQVNVALKRAGYLRFETDHPRSLKELADGTRAFSLDPGRVYLNLKDRFSRGCVSVSDRTSLLDDLTALFDALEVGGKRVIRRIYRKEEIFEGSWLEQAPDLVLLGEQGFNLRAGIKATQLVGKDVRTGKHTHPDAFLIVHGDHAQHAVPDRPTVSDVVGIIDQAR
jgi:predicted AlkP superfamily phosphohydrolase/phosphomutase